ncbi:hypothetical protein RHGRI_032835 [Rhododendron griersonianum]|uniref:RBR-type E3 ubiquitin transferase n=1 Tax=Rhododendron griersonianum TaxID=479676 RepID=A0AAV6IDC9_9ERIC|nr:hypothetical protein RHGRI_032835 [Rhododendron griersonianum]
MGNTNSAEPHQEQAPPPSLPEPPSDFTCEICIEPTLPPTKKFTNNNLCAHPFCTDCITKYAQVKIEDDRAAEIKCPGLNCDNLIDPISCRALIPPVLFDKWCDLLCERALLGFDRCYCPNRVCSAAVVNECGGTVRRAACPNCKRLFCFSCKAAWHAGYRCEESGQLRDRNDVAFGVLAELLPALKLYSSTARLFVLEWDSFIIRRGMDLSGLNGTPVMPDCGLIPYVL